MVLNNDIQELEKVVELNKNNVENTNAISEELDKEAKSLDDLIDSFVKSV